MKEDKYLDLLEQINLYYGIVFDKFELVRDWIGQVYVGIHNNIRYIVKVFRTQHTKEALQAIEVMAYLKNNEFNIPGIYNTLQGSKYFVYHHHMVVLYEYILGEDMEKAGDLTEVGLLYGQMRKSMIAYADHITRHGYEFFIERYLNIMKKKEYQGIDKYINLGNYLWEKVKGLPNGFIHGDFHSGNMILNRDKITVFDFDACANASPVYDIATYCDASDYFDLSDYNFDYSFSQTKMNVKKFLEGYERNFTLTKEEEKAIYYFIAIRHFDIQATIIDCQGINCVNEIFFDNQYVWLEKWMNHLNS